MPNIVIKNIEKDFLREGTTFLMRKTIMKSRGIEVASIACLDNERALMYKKMPGLSELEKAVHVPPLVDKMKNASSKIERMLGEFIVP